MFNPLALKILADLAVSVLNDKEFELKDILLQAVTSSIGGLDFAKQLGFQVLTGEQNGALGRQFIDLSDTKLLNIDRIKQGFNPIDAFSGQEILVFKNIEANKLIELTQKEFDANFNVSNFENLDNQATQVYWKNRLDDINNLKIGDIMSFGESLGIQFNENAGIIRGVKDGVEVVHIDKATNSGWVQVGIYKKGSKPPFLSGIKPGQFNGNIEYRYEVRGNFYDKIGSYIPIQRADGSIVDIPIICKKEMIHGMMVSYNVPDFTKFATASVDIPEHVIQLNAQEHKRYAIKILAEKFHNGEIAKGTFSPDIEAQLEKIYIKQKAPCSLKGYEIHHDGNGRMQFILKDIHCRRASHLSGSWLMNHKNYGLDLLYKTSDFKDINKDNLRLSSSFIQDVKLTEVLTSFSELDKYPSASVIERKAILTNFTDRITKASELKDTNLIFKPMPQCELGSYNGNTITINENILQSGLNCEEPVDTILHEVRHAIQFDAINNPSKYDIPASILEKWRYEINNYIHASLDFEAYSQQSIEIDANEWAGQYTSLIIA